MLMKTPPTKKLGTQIDNGSYIHLELETMLLLGL